MKPTNLKGTRDFLPHEALRRKFIFSSIEKRFQRYSFRPIETPAMERLSTLTGKYGEEGDRLIFKVLNSGDFLKKADQEALNTMQSGRLATSIAEKALRYDLTVPFARFVVQHQNEIQFPFKRYQIQPVWRADRPQKGRYQEFYQCDADVVGSTSLRNDVEMIHLMDDVLSGLGLSDVTIKVNNRKILTGLTHFLGIADRLNDFAIAIDKLDKIGVDGVMDVLKKQNMPASVLAHAPEILSGQLTSKQLETWLDPIEIGKEGLNELNFILNRVNPKTASKVKFEISLARGLDYYTGSIFEVVSDEYPIGSICGGGRYDDLTGVFGLKGLSGIGISFGADRIYDVLLALDRFPDRVEENHRLLFLNFGEVEADYCTKFLADFRKAGIACELYPDQVKIQKQMKYADANDYRWVAMVGENEISNDTITLKNMNDGSQSILNLQGVIELIMH